MTTDFNAVRKRLANDYNNLAIAISETIGEDNVTALERSELARILKELEHVRNGIVAVCCVYMPDNPGFKAIDIESVMLEEDGSIYKE